MTNGEDKNKEPRWEPFIERKFRDCFYGNITKEEYDLAEQYVAEGKSYSMTFQEWLEKKNI